MSDVSLQRQLDNAWLEVKNAEGKLDAANIEIARLRELLLLWLRGAGREELASHIPDEEQVRNERERLLRKLEKIENLSKHAWEQVDKNPAEAQELFRMIYAESK